MEPEGKERGRSWPFVPFLGKKSWLGPSRTLGLASQISTNDNLFAHSTPQQQRVLRKMCPPPSTVMSISIKQNTLCSFGRAVRSSWRRKRGQHTCSSSSYKTVFLGLHGICSMSATNQYQFIWQVISHSVRSSALWRRVKTRPKCLTIIDLFEGLWLVETYFRR